MRLRIIDKCFNRFHVLKFLINRLNIVAVHNPSITPTAPWQLGPPEGLRSPSMFILTMVLRTGVQRKKRRIKVNLIVLPLSF